MKRFKKIGIVLAVIVTIIVVLNLVVTSIYKKEIISYALTAVNEQLKVPVEVNEVDFSLWKRFPYTSVTLKDVKIEDVISAEKKGQLLHIGKVYLKISLLEMLLGEKSIKQLEFNNGEIAVRIAENGGDNFHFWKTSQENKEGMYLQLEEVVFRDMKLNYEDNKQKIQFHLNVDRLIVNGVVGDSLIKMKLDHGLLVERVAFDGEQVLSSVDVHGGGAFLIDLINKEVIVEDFQQEIQGSEWILNGEMHYEQERSYNLYGKVLGLTAEMVAQHMVFPEGMAVDRGGVEAMFEIKGGDIPMISIEGDLRDLSVKYKRLPLKGSDVKFHLNKPTNTSWSRSDVTFSEVDLVVGKGSKVSGSAEIKKMRDWKTNLTLDGSLDEIQLFVSDLMLEGDVNGQVRATGSFVNKQVSIKEVVGNLKVKDVAYPAMSLKDASGAISFVKDNKVLLKKFQGALEGSLLEAELGVDNLLGNIFNDEVSTVAGKLLIEELNIPFESSKQKRTERIHLPENIQGNIQVECGVLNYNKVQLTDVKTVLGLGGKRAVLNRISASGFDGEIKGKFQFVENVEGYQCLGEVETYRVDIHQLFKQFEDFDQESISYKHLKGDIDVVGVFHWKMDTNYRIVPSTIEIESEFTIYDGELIEYNPLLSLSKFVEIDELEHVRFSTLKSSVDVMMEEVRIGRTDIVSNALNLRCEGTHGFDQSIDYRVKLLLSDVLWNKSKKKKKNQEFGYIEETDEGRTSLFFKIKGDVDDPKVRYDVEGVRTQWKENAEKEKKTIKKLLNKEFGLFKKSVDVDAVEDSPRKKKQLFLLDLEEEDGDGEKTIEKKSKKQKKKGFFQKLADPNEDEYESSDDF